MLLVLFIAFSLAASQSLETFGIWGRVWGALIGGGSSGYSLHVRIASLGRFFTFAVAPTLGYLVDVGNGSKAILQIASVAYLLIFLSSFVIFFISKNSIFRVFSKTQGAQLIRNSVKHYRIDKFIVVLGIGAFSMTSSGLLVANFLAANFPDNRGMWVQFNSLITACGTLIHVFFVDPKISRYCDSNVEDSWLAANSYILSRMLGSFLLFTVAMTALFGSIN